MTELAIPGVVEMLPGRGNMPKVRLTHASGARAEVYLHGAHITSWTTAQGDDLFFVSRASHFTPDRPIRGGIPVIFPQFGGGVLPQHGFARTSEWQLIASAVQADGEVNVALRLTDFPQTLAMWPHHFVLDLGMRLAADALTVSLRVTNTGDTPFAFQEALHTYFAVADIRHTALYGLQGVTYLDALRERARFTEAREEMRFAEEVDRIYEHAPSPLRLADERNGRIIRIEIQHMPDVVVWNPWIDKAQRMPDFGDDEYLNMLCVETGQMASSTQLLPGDTWSGETRYSHRG